MSLLVRHVMTEAPKTLSTDMSAADAAGLMTSFDVGAIPVTDGDDVVGLVTDRDIVVRVVAARQDPNGTSLGTIATKGLVTASPDMGVAEARRLMSEHQVRRLPVMKSDRLVGIVSIGDLAVTDPAKRAIGDTLEAVSVSESTRSTNGGPERGTPERTRR